MAPVVQTAIDQVEIKYVNGQPAYVFFQTISTVVDSSNNNAIIAGPNFDRQTYNATDPLMVALVAAAAAAVASAPQPS
jgi:hypothetical protein